MIPVKRPKLAQISVFVLVVLTFVGGITADVPIHPIRAGNQQPGHAFVDGGDDVAVLQSKGSCNPQSVSRDVAILAHDQGLGHFRVVIEELEQSLDHALGMGCVFCVLPQKQRDSERGCVATVMNVTRGAGI
ncbi:hypothetical protein D3C86_1293760 [compost metagenome]